MRRSIALIALFACDSPFFGARPDPPLPETCAYQVDFRCGGEFPGYRPAVTIESPCTIHVDASDGITRSLSFTAVVGEDGVEITEGPCHATEQRIDCGECVFPLLEVAPLPFPARIDHCTFAGCEDARWTPPRYTGTRVSIPSLQAGHLVELVADGAPIFVANEVPQPDVICPNDSRVTEHGFVGGIDRMRSEPCVHTLERANDAYVGLFGNRGVLRIGRFSLDSLALVDSSSIALPPPEDDRSYFNVTALAYDGDRTVIVALNSSSRWCHLLTFDANTLAPIDRLSLPPISADEQHYVFGIQATEAGWIYTDDGTHAIHQISALLEPGWSANVLAVLGRNDLGAILTIEHGSISVDTYRNRLIVEQDRAIAETAGAISDVLLTPTFIAHAGDLIAVGLFDKETTTGHLGFFDPKALRFLPGTIPLGHGPVGRIRFTRDRLWIMLPWQGKVVELIADAG